MPIDSDTTEVPPEARVELDAERKRTADFMIRFLNRWPNFRRHLAGEQLGAAIALADLMGMDVEAFLAHLREQEPHPGVLTPPRPS